MAGILVDLKTTGKEKSPFKDCTIDESVTNILLLSIGFDRLTYSGVGVSI